MKKNFINKYKNYCKSGDTRDGIFQMIQGENESLEYYEHRFHPIYQRDNTCALD